MKTPPSKRRPSDSVYRATLGITLSSRVRLARNLRGRPFPEKLRPEGRLDLRQRVMEAAREILPVQECLPDLPALSRRRLFENHLISGALLKGCPESGICMNEDRTRSVLINEEDHLRIQALRPGLALHDVWADVNGLDDAMESTLDYAFSSSLGYLTSCPTNVGTGMRASVMMHLPGLVLLKEMEPIMNGLSKIGLTVRGRWGEGTTAIGNMFQVSNQRTLGLSEDRIISDLEEIVKEIAGHEQNARERLKQERAMFIADLVARAEGILASACLMTAQEALERLSELRLGIALGLTKGIRMQQVDQWLLELQPAHLQTLAGREMKTEERDLERARRLRSLLKRPAKPRRSTPP